MAQITAEFEFSGSTYTVEIETREAAWWRWHDADSSRWSSSTEEAEARARAWALGQSDDGPEEEEAKAVEIMACADTGEQLSPSFQAQWICLWDGQRTVGPVADPEPDRRAAEARLRRWAEQHGYAVEPEICGECGRRFPD